MNGRRVAAQKAISSGRTRACRWKYSLALAKEAHWPPHEQADHHEVNDKGAKPGEVVLARHVAHAENQRRGERAADRAEAADGHDDQHVDEVRQRERVIEPDDLDRGGATKTGEAAAEREGDHERAVDVDAEAARHALVVD